MRSLQVFIDHRLVGTLSEGDDLWTFEYDPLWAAAPDGFDLSPAFPRAQLRHEDGGTLRPVQWYFDNLLPEELLRQTVAKEAGIRGEDAFALLEHLGAESAGSLTLLAPSQALPDEARLQLLSDESLSGRIQALPRQTLAKTSPKRMSLAGAQHKLLVVIKAGLLYEPEGATPSTHILKPEHPDVESYPASVFNEFLTMRLARVARLSVPPVAMRHVPQPVYLIERFDRVIDQRSLAGNKDPLAAPSVQRLHIIDACQLLNKARTFKHVGASLDALVEVIDRTTNKIDTRQRLFRWLVFNILVANDDCHLKNLSFHVRPDGVALAPHYDLLCTGAYHTRALADDKAIWDQVPMAFSLPGAKYFGDVTLTSVLQAAAVLGVPERVARRVVAEVTTRVASAFEGLVAEQEARWQTLPKAWAPYAASESRLLRVVQHIILPEMLSRLQG
ncbi:MAG: HipA domain-containing protein [Aquabacterium sp.]|uniref:HipA domain-containing protein n=1 Tax=Aquabacterium sp. TaxID=1872578 RepID=UPI00271F766A|nr:HipA domain-containing protein [Aquabacterium sp.]MDO9002755.1 HipA domain-containing protein [Aquabacterium sp.]